MEEHPDTKTTVIKVLAIVGFSATIILLIWLLVVSISRAPGAFSSLAGIAASLRVEKPITEISIAIEKSVVNSREPFSISWTDVKQKGTYALSYACVDGLELLVRDSAGKLNALTCEDTLPLPDTVQKLYLSILSKNERFSDLTMKLVFTPADGGTTLESSAKITVVNAAIPVGETGEEIVPEENTIPVTKPEATTTPVVTKPTIPTPKPSAPVLVYPQSDPNGFTDLAVTTIGSGVLRNGVFVRTATYESHGENVIVFDIKNIGTKTSDTWTFTSVLPSGFVYTSEVQIPLKPKEHVTFTLSFDMDSDEDDAYIKNTVFTNRDTSAQNNSATWYVPVE